MAQITHWINGKPWDGTPARTGKVYDPATGAVQSEVALASPEVVDAAVAAAAEAFPAWRDSPITRRQNVMFAYRELVVENRHEIAKLITAEHGKTTPDALGEVQRGLEVVEFACNIAHMVKGEFSEQVSTGVDTFTMRQPLGVVAGITPFNFPAMVPMWMYPLAIAAGNTFILKPSEKDPSPSMFCAELLKEAGLPPGVFNVVHGDKEAVDRILEHPDIQAVSFVGSTPSRITSMRTEPRPESASRPWAGPRTTWSCCPTPTWTWPPTPPSRRATDRPASGAWPFRWWYRSAMPPIGSSPK